MNIISRQEARAQGMNRYFNGKRCVNGHLCERRVCNKHCIKCESADDKRRKTKMRVPRRVHEDAYRAPPPPRAFIERDYRLSLPRTLTASLMGDPPPGYSALDRR